MSDAADIVAAMGEDLSRFSVQLGARSIRLANEAVRDLRASLADPHIGPWGEASRFAAMAVIGRGVADLQRRQAGLLTEAAPAIAAASHGRMVRLLSTLDREFAGSVRPLTFAPLAWLERQSREIGQIRLREYTRSFERYGAAAVTQIEEALTKLALTGQPWTKARPQVWAAVRDVVGDRQWMVDRILRTETSAIYNGTALAGLIEKDRPDAPMLKRLVSTFDNRTGRDSIAVHGQVRRAREPFFDPVGGRSYMAPPNRPHDREILVPHRPEWGERPPPLTRVPQDERRETSAPELPPKRRPPHPPRPVPRPSLLAATAAVTLLAGQVQEARAATRRVPATDRGPFEQQQRALIEQLRQAQVKLAIERIAADPDAPTIAASALRAGEVLSAGGVEVRVVSVRGGLALQIGDTRLMLGSPSVRLPLRREAPAVRAVALEASAVLAAIVAATPHATISPAA